MILLDSDFCIDLLRGRLHAARDLMMRGDPSIFGIPAVVEAELRLGAQKSDHPRKNRLLVEAFLAPFQRIPFDSECAVAYARIRAQLEGEGCVIGPNDMLIAATAVAHNAILVTGNTREFCRVRGLEVEDWSEAPL